jgi:hypothetical protein
LSFSSFLILHVLIVVVVVVAHPCPAAIGGITRPDNDNDNDNENDRNREEKTRTETTTTICDNDGRWHRMGRTQLVCSAMSVP